MKKVLLITILIFSTIDSYAIERITKGQAAPYSGAIITEREVEEYTDLVKKEAVRKAQIKNLNDLRIIQDERIDFYQLQVKEVRRELLKSDSKRWLTNIGYFVLGVAITGFAAKAAIESTR